MRWLVIKYGQKNDKTTSVICCCKVLLSILMSFCFLFCNGQARLLDPKCPNNSDIWKGNNSYDYNHLKSRLSYLCPVPNAVSNSKYMRSFQRIPKRDGETAIASGNYVKKTCLSVSYNKDWVDFPDEETKERTTDNIKLDNPDIVYAYSTGNSSAGYDIYYWVDDRDDTNNPYSVDDNIKPKLVGDATQLFQIGNDVKRLKSIDISGWDFSGVTCLEKFFSGCTSLASINMGAPDLQNVTSIKDMFANCSKLPRWGNGGFENLINSWRIDAGKLQSRAAAAKMFNGIQVTTANNVRYDITSSGSFERPFSGDPTLTVRNTDAIQRGANIKISWDVLYEKYPNANPGAGYVIQYLEGGKNWVSDAAQIVELATISATAESKDLKSYEYTYEPSSPESFEGEKQFRIKTIKTNGDELFSEPFTCTYYSDVATYPLYYEIIRKDGDVESPFPLYLDDEGNISLIMDSGDSYEYIIPDGLTITCNNFYIATSSEDYCNSKFISKGIVNAKEEIVLTNSKNTPKGIQYDCDGTYIGKDITFQGSLPEIKGVFNIENMFTTVSNGQGQDITIGRCASIRAYEGNFQHSGGAMKLYIDGEMTVERLIEGNMIHVRDGGMLIVGETDFDPSLKIVSYSGSVLTLCYNPTSGVDNLGFCAGTVFYNDNVLEHGWSTNPQIEGDINEWTVASDSHSSEYNTAVGIVGKNPIKADIGSPAFHSYSECIDPSKTHELLGIADDPFLPKDKKISPLYNKNCCSEEFSNNKIQIREFGNKWFRLINGELIYCENDN